MLIPVVFTFFICMHLQLPVSDRLEQYPRVRPSLSSNVPGGPFPTSKVKWRAVFGHSMCRLQKTGRSKLLPSNGGSHTDHHNRLIGRRAAIKRILRTAVDFDSVIMALPQDSVLVKNSAERSVHEVMVTQIKAHLPPSHVAPPRQSHLPD